MKRAVILALAFILALFLGAGRPANAQDADDVVRVNTTMVVLPVRVVDRHKQIVTGLKQDQFRVFEDGVEQQIAYFEGPSITVEAPSSNTSTTEEETSHPLTIALMVDISDSTEFKLQQIRSTAQSFVDLLRPNDRVVVMAFDKGVQMLSQSTSSHAEVRAGIGRLRHGGGTSLYTALDSAITMLNRLGGRKVIILLTDGVDTSSKGATSESTLQAAEQSYVSIYPIQFDTYGDFAESSSRETYGSGEFGKVAHVTKNGEPASEAYKRATLYLRLLAEKTSGRFQFADSPKNLANSFSLIAERLRQQYTIGYYPKNKSATAKPRQIKVTVTQPEVGVETRKSYVYKTAGN